MQLRKFINHLDTFTDTNKLSSEKKSFTEHLATKGRQETIWLVYVGSFQEIVLTAGISLLKLMGYSQTGNSYREKSTFKFIRYLTRER